MRFMPKPKTPKISCLLVHSLLYVFMLAHRDAVLFVQLWLTFLQCPLGAVSPLQLCWTDPGFCSNTGCSLVAIDDCLARCSANYLEGNHLDVLCKRQPRCMIYLMEIKMMTSEILIYNRKESMCDSVEYKFKSFSLWRLAECAESFKVVNAPLIIL